MKLKTVVTTLSVLALATAGSAFAGSSVAQLQAQMNKLQAQVNAMSSAHGVSGAFVQTNAMLAQNTLSTETGVATEMTILNAKKAGKLNGSLYVGGMLKGYANYYSVQNSGSTHTTKMGVSNDSGLAVLANVNKWVSAFVSVSGLGNGSTSTGGQGSNTGYKLTAGNAYVVVGNLNASPVYAFAGRKDVDFGNFQSVNFAATPLNRAVFETSGNTLGFGYAKNGFNGVVSFMNGGSGTTANNINNFAVNAHYGQSNNGVNWKVGAGYLNGTAYAASGARNAAWDVNAQVSMANLKVIGEYTQTAKQYSGNNVQAWNIGALYNFPMMGHKSAFNVSYSAAKDAATVTQIVAGYNVEMFNNLWTGLQYQYVKATGTSSIVSGSTPKASSVSFVATAYF